MNYSFEHSPPAPCLKVRFTRPFSSRSLELQAKLDTGADMTVIPQNAVSELGLIPASRVSVSPFDGRKVWRYTFFVNISFNGFEYKMVEVINAQRRDALIGRDVLNRLKTVLDGKALSLSILDP